MTPRSVPILLLALAITALCADGAVRWREATAGDVADHDSLVKLLDEVGVRVIFVEGTLLAVNRADVDGLIARNTGISPRAADSNAAVQFAERGGRLLVVGEHAVAEKLGVTISPARIHPTDHGPLRGAGEHQPLLDGAMPIVRSIGAVLMTQNASFVDADGDGRASERDVGGPFVVGARALDGSAMVLSVPGLLDDDTLADPATRAFVRATLTDHFPSGSTVALDRTRAADAPMRDAFLATAVDASTSSPLTLGVWLLALTAAATSWRIHARRPMPIAEEQGVPLPRVRP